MTDRDLLPAVTRIDTVDPVSGDRQLIVVLVAASLPEPWRRRLQPAVIEQRPLAPTRRRHRLLYAGLAAMVPATVLAWFAIDAYGPDARPRNSVEVAIPSGLEIDLAAVPPLPREGPKPPQPAIAPVPPTKKEQRPVPAKLLNINRFPEVQAAIAAAFASGVAQPWAAKGIEGYALVGPARIDGSHACRNVAVWVKDSAEGQTLSVRKCLAENGAWVDVGEPSLVVDPPIG